MVCPRCTLLHPDAVAICHQCGYRFTTALQQCTALVVRDARIKIGATTGTVLFCCLLTAVLAPGISAVALAVGAYAGIISIANSWLATCTAAEGDRAVGIRGTIFSVALLYSLAAELARLHGADRILLPEVGGTVSLQVPSAAITELLAAVLILMDPLLAHPMLRWLGEGVQRSDT